jgi:peptidyl-prolyl cis-trans isomerase D
MITSLQNFFLKHNKWLFGGLLVVIIVTFVLTIGPQSFFGSGGSQQRQALKYYGYDLSSQADQRAMGFTAEISAILHPELRLRREQLMDYAYLRVAALGLADQLGIPNPDKDALAGFVETLQIFQDPQTGEFSAESYQRMLEALQSNARFDRESVALVLREDYRISRVRDALGGPAYSLPFENRQDYIDRETSYTITLANFDYESFDPEINPGDDELTQYYKENPSRYEIPETISVTALLFKAEAYLDEVPAPSEELLEAYFTSRKARYAKQPEADAAEDAAPVEVTLAEVRDQVVADWQREQAAKVAAKKSEQFSLKLWQNAVLLDSEPYKALLEEFKVQPMPVPPYSREQAPRIAEAPAELLNSMWIYTSNPTRYFSDIAQIADGAVVLVTNGVTEARMPDFAEVRDAVAGDYKLAEKRRLFAEKGAEVKESIESGLSAQSFAELAESLGLAVEQLEPFTGINIPAQLRAGSLWEQVRYLGEGELSDLILQADKGTFAYVAEKSIPEVDTNSGEYKAYMDQRNLAMNETMGWARLREITDQSLNALLGPTAVE